MNWKLAVIGHRRRAIPIRNVEFCGSKILAVFSLIACCSLAAAADEITGAVRNQSRGQAAAGDAVILLRLDQGMQEEARATTNTAGAFAIKVQFPDKPHLIRIIHQGVNYDQRASAGDILSVNVFDAATKVQGVTGSIEIMRTGTSGNLLHVSDMIEVRNESSPPMTQAGERTFDVYLPAQAKIDSVMAAGSGKLGVTISASPVAGEPGHYTVNFPLRPGSTRFAFNYDLPYDGHAAFRPRLAYPLQQLAVMIPPTMKFASRSPAFQLLATGSTDYQVQAANRLNAGDAPAFEISGSGTIPPLQARSQTQTGDQMASPAGSAVPGASARESTSPGAGSAPQASAKNDLRGRAAASRQAPEPEWWLLGATAMLALGAWGFLIWRARRGSRSRAELVNAPATRARPSASPPSLLEALKEELLELETNRLAGSISRQEYDAAKRTLERTVKRALTQAAAKS